MTHENGFHNGDPLTGGGSRLAGEEWIGEIVRHVALALGAHVRRLHQEALPAPREVEELAAYLIRLARTRPGPPTVAGELSTTHHDRVPDRLLVTKAEAAERLGVSVRTVERLVAAGRLRQVHVERLARFRVRDLEEYVGGLTDDAGN